MGTNFRWHRLGEVLPEHEGCECVIVPHPRDGRREDDPPIFGVIEFTGPVAGFVPDHAAWQWLPLIGSDEIGIKTATSAKGEANAEGQ